MKLRTLLTWLVAGTLLPLVVLASVLGYLMVEHERETFRRGALDRNRAFMIAIDSVVTGHLRTLEAIAAGTDFESDAFERLHGEMRDVLKSQPDWQNVILSRPAGGQLFGASRPFGSPASNISDMESFTSLVQGRIPVIGKVILGRTSKRYGLPLRVPVIRDGRLIYVLTAILQVESFQKLIEAQDLPANWVSGLVDASGHFIARVPVRTPADRASDNFLAAVRGTSEGWYRGRTVEGRDTFTAHLTSAFTGWSVGLGIPTAEVNAAAYRTAWIMGLGTLATFALVIGFAVWMARRITVPIASLASAARSLGRNERAPVLNAAVGIEEVREVAGALADASIAIHERQDLVERERTALQAADKAKDEFLAMLGHELRNPLGVITLSAQVLRAAAPGDPAESRAHDIIERQTRHMTRLIEDLLDLSRVTMGKVSLLREAFDLSLLTRRVVQTWAETPREASRPVTVATAVVRVNADRSRIEQILTNLLDNADKFSPLGKAIRVSLVREGAEAILEVADQGEGLLPGMLNEVFALFVQAPSGPDRARGGMGVGLALVKRIAEMHGGTASARSAGPGQGATFSIRLPAEDDHAGNEAPVATLPASSSAQRILVVEDNEDARQMMLMMLELEGHSVHGAPTGEAGVRAAAEWVPDVALVDVGLPDIDGYEVARRIRANPTSTQPWLVAVTGYGQAEDVQRAFAAGFDRHLTKPVTLETLRAVFSAL